MRERRYILYNVKKNGRKNPKQILEDAYLNTEFFDVTLSIPYTPWHMAMDENLKRKKKTPRRWLLFWSFHKRGKSNEMLHFSMDGKSIFSTEIFRWIIQILNDSRVS